MASIAVPLTGILLAFAGIALADESTDGSRALPRGGNALAADIAALDTPAVRRGGHALGSDIALLDQPSGRRGGHLLGADTSTFDNSHCETAAAPDCPLTATVAEN